MDQEISLIDQYLINNVCLCHPQLQKRFSYEGTYQERVRWRIMGTFFCRLERHAPRKPRKHR